MDEGEDLTFTITASEAVSEDTDVAFTVSGIDADDIAAEALPTSATIAAGETSADVTLSTVDDGVADGNETVELTLDDSDASANATVLDAGAAEATFSIAADSTTVDEGTPADDGSTDDGSAPEGNELTLTVTRSGVTDGEATVAVQSTDGSAQAGSDFETVSETVTFADGETEQTVTLTTIPDDVRETDETLTVDLGSPSTGSVSADNGSVEITIANDDENELPVITAPSETHRLRCRRY